ncbi:hypothetical protein ACV07N_00340 [Roseivirga echinicomitans]
MIVIGVFAFSMNLNAFNMNEPGGGCSSEGPTYVCGNAEINQLEQDALRNCCAGSSVEWEDVCGSRTGTVNVIVDGPNSSCANP